MENQESQEIQDGPVNDWVVSEGQDEVLSNNESLDNTTSEQTSDTTENLQEEQPTESVEPSEDQMSDQELLSHMLSEQYGQDFNDVSAFEDYMSSKYKTPENTESQFANETLKQINDYVKQTGRTVEDYMVTQSLKPDEMSDQEAVMFMLNRENPGLSKEDLKFYMEETYKLKAEDDSNEKRFGEIALKKEALRAKSEIQSFKEHYKAPISDIANAKQNEQETQQLKDSFYNDVVEDMEGIEGLTFEVDDKGNEFTFAINDSNRPNPDEYVNQLDNFFNQYQDENGNWNYDQLNTDMFILNNIDSIIKSVANHYRSQGTEEVVQELKNPSYEGKDAKPSSDAAPSMAQQIFKAMQQNNDF